jgi:hypothetical protein
MIRFLDSFSHYDAARLLYKWTTYANAGLGLREIVVGGGRCLQNAYQLTQVNVGQGEGIVYHPPFANLTEGTLQTGFRIPPNNSGNPHMIFSLFYNGTIENNRVLSLGLNSNNTLGLYTGYFGAGGNLTEVVRSLRAVNDSSWHSVGWTFKTDPAAGASSVYIDGDLGDPYFTFAGNTGAAHYTDFQLGVANGGGTLRYSDFFWGDLQTDVKGDSRVFARLPNREGPILQWTPSSGAIHYQMVDENPPNDDTDWNSDRTPGNEDLYGFPSIGIASGTVYAVQTNMLMKKTDIGFRSVAPVIQIGGVDYVGLTRAIADGSWLYYMQCWDQNDPAGNPWSVPNAVNSYYGARTIV